MIKVTVQKNLVGLEDLLVGVGTVEQSRGPTGTAAVTITKINGANFPYDATTSMGEKFDALEALIDTLPVVVDEGGNLLTGLINTSSQQLDLTGRLWRKEIDVDTAGIYYGDQLILTYDPVDGNIYIPGGTDYIAADVVVTSAFQAADAILTAAIASLDAQTEAIHDLDVGTDIGELVQLEDVSGSAGLPAVDGSQLTGLPGGLPIGTIIWAVYNTPDAGYLKANGAEVSRTTYAALYAKIGDTYGNGDGSTTFDLPDLRGEFVRGWDDERGIDTGRTIGSNQSESFTAHTHGAGTLATNSAGNHTHPFLSLLSSGQSNPHMGYGTNANDTTQVTNATALKNAGAHTHTITGSTASSGASETRPRNIALMAMIKAL